MLKTAVSLLIALLLNSFALAQTMPASGLYDGKGQPSTLEQELSQVRPGTIVVLGEMHGTQVQADQQLQVIDYIKNKGILASVGLEFFSYPQQADVDLWRQGSLPEAEFLKKIGWGMGFPFSAYKGQALRPELSKGEVTLALNAPKALTSQIAKVGISGLTPELAAFMPPGFALGNAGYFARFQEVMGNHLPSPEAAARYFEAQSTWDDTMAWQATQFIQGHPDQVLVIVVGEFHVQYGGGLPDRLRARGAQVLTLSLVNLFGLSAEEQKAAVEPDLTFGSRADFIWTSTFGPVPSAPR